jgi:WD40 repeat protein/serine/threonine protein kinase
MPAPTTIEEFLELGQKSGLLDEEGIGPYLEQKRAAASLPNAPKPFAKLLVRDGLLTSFQAEQLLLGKWRGFNIAGKYKLLGYLGAGGMARVFLCEHMIMRRRVAIKVLPSSQVNDPGCLERFHREARAAAALDHPNIVRAFDIDRDGELHFLVMEYIDGAGLDQVVKEQGPLDPVRAARYVAAAACGLEHAHRAGLVHRDVKPSNLLVDRTDTVKILDMGLARFFHDKDDELTKEHDSERVLGTADYLAPEQAVNSHDVDIRADIYSLGVTFYFLLTGKSPFGDEPVVQKLLGHLMREPRPIRDLRPDVPQELVAVIARMMAKDRDARYQTPAEVVEALAPWAQLPAPPAPEVGTPRGTTSGTADTMKVKPAHTPATGRVANLATVVRPKPAAPPQATGIRKEKSRAKPSENVKTASGSARIRAVVRPPSKVRRKGAPTGSQWRWIVIGSLAAAGVLIALTAVLLYAFKGKGTVVVEIQDPDIEVRILGGGQEIIINDNQAKHEFPLKPGEYQVLPGPGVRLTPDQFTLTRGGRKTVLAWRDHTEIVHRFPGHTAQIEGVAFSRDGKRALSTGHDKTIRLWEIPSGRLVRELKGQEGPGWCVAFLPDGRRAISSSSDGLLRLWNLDTGEVLQRFTGHVGEVKAAAVSPDGRWVLSGGQDNTVRLWDVDFGRELHQFNGHTAAIWCVAFSPDGRQGLSCGTDRTIRLWDLVGRKELRVLAGHTDEVRRVAFSPDGQRALSCGFDMKMRLWDLKTGHQIREYDGQPYYVESIDFSRSGRYALTSEGMVPNNDPIASRDRGIRLWDLETGKQIYRRSDVPDKVLHTIFSPDNRYALSACDDKIVRLWELPPLPDAGR